MPTLSSIANIPFLSAYRQREAQIRGEGMDELKQVSGVMTLQGLLQKQQEAQRTAQRDQQYRSDVAALGPNPTQEQLAVVGSKYAGPEKLLDIHQKSLDRKATSDDRASIANDNRAQMAMQFAQNLDLRQQDLDRRRDEFAQRTTDANAKQAFEQWYKTESLKNQQTQQQLNAQLRGLGFEIQRQGQQLQLSRLDMAQLDRVDRGVTAFANELQQNKVPGLASSMTAANSLLKQYEDKPDIPGIGAVEGSAMLPNLFRGNESNNVRSALQAVANDLLNMYSGLAVTLPESERRELEQMRRGDFKEADFRNAWPRTVERYNGVVGNLTAGASPEVRRQYGSRPGAMRLDPIEPAFKPKAAMSAAPASSGAVREFATEVDAAAANLPKGTKVKIGGVPGTWQ